MSKYEPSEDPPSAATPPAEVNSNKRVPIDTLARLFPQVKRTVLRSTLDRCDGDVLRAIEQLVYHNNNPQPGGEAAPRGPASPRAGSSPAPPTSSSAASCSSRCR